MILITALRRVKVPIEVPCLFLVLALLIAESVTGNLIIYRTCYVILDYNETECVLLGSTHPNNNTANLEQLVQPYATHLLTWKGLMQAVISMIPCFFLGPWSDKYGRKPVLLCTVTGFVLTYFLKTVLCAITTASPWYFLLAVLPMCMFGGFPTFTTVALAYITDTVPEENRPVRFGTIQALVATSMLIGTASSSFILRATSYFIVHLISTCLMVTALIIFALFIPESQAKPEKKDKFRNLFNFGLAKDTLKTILMKRENYDRGLLLTTTVLTIIYAIVFHANGGLSFLYLRQKLHWSLQKSTLYGSANQIVTIIWSMVGSYVLYKLLNIKESVLMTVGLTFLFLGSLVQGFAFEDWHVYIGGVLTCFGCLVTLMARSLVSKIIPTGDCGKVFSLLIVFETLFALIGSPIYAFIYSNTLATFPGLFNFVTAGIFFLEIILSSLLIFMQNKHQ